MSRSSGLLSDQRHCSHWRNDSPDYYSSNLRLPIPTHQQQQYGHVRPQRTAPPADPDRVRRRINVACIRCRKRKIKCSGPINDGVCQNCTEASVQKEECQYHRVQSKSLDCEIGQLRTSSSPTTGSSQACPLGQIQEQEVVNQGYPRWTAGCQVHSPTAREPDESYIPFGYNNSVGQLGPRGGITTQSFPSDPSLVDQSAYGTQATGPITSWSAAVPSTPVVSPFTSSAHDYAGRQLPVPSTSQQQQQAEAYGSLTSETQTMTGPSCRYGATCTDPHYTAAAELASRCVGPYSTTSRTASGDSDCPLPAMVQAYPSYMGTTDQDDLTQNSMAHSMPVATQVQGTSSDDHNGYAHAGASSRATEMHMYGQMYDPRTDPRFASLDVLASTSAMAQNGLAVPASNVNSSGWQYSQRGSAAGASGRNLASKDRHKAR